MLVVFSILNVVLCKVNKNCKKQKTKTKQQKNRAAKPQISFDMKTIETFKNNDSGKHYTRKS